MKKKYKVMICIVACFSGSAIGVAIATSGYIDSLYNRLNPPIWDWSQNPQEQLIYTYLVWGPGNAYCNITIRNTGHSVVTIVQVVQVEIDNTKETLDASVLPYTLTKDGSITIKATGTFNSGVQYSFMVVTAKGNQFGPFRGIAP